MAVNRQELIDACLALPGAYEDYPFTPLPGDKPVTVMRHRGNRKTFAMILEHGGRLLLNLKCPPAEADLLRQLFQGVIPGWHMNKVHWNSVVMDTDVPEEEILRQIGLSYDLTKPRRS